MAVKERREREKEQRRREILAAARSLLLEGGLQGASVNKIAKISELSIGAIYFYFRDKEEIYAALQIEGLDLLHGKILGAVAATTPPEEAARQIARAYLRFSEENSSYFDILNYFLTSPKTLFSPELKTRIDEHGANSLNILAAAIARGIKENIFRETDPRREAIILWCACHGAIMLRKLEATIVGKGQSPLLFNDVVERFLSGLRRQ